jgi:ubiquinone/menaquinone biosynthesis C-methylase UbiE
MLEQNYKKFSEQVKDYFEQDYWRSDEEFLIEKYFSNKQGKLLVLGCGAGRTLVPLYKKGFTITAIDIVQEMVDFAQRKVDNLSVEVLLMDATNLKLSDNSFDYVFFPFHGIDYIYPDIYKCVKEVSRVLKPGGVFIFNSHNRWFLKKLNKLFLGKYSDYNGIITYRTTYFDYFKLKKYFDRVKIVQRISLYPWRDSNWKDIAYKIFSPLSKSTYFICQQPKEKL